MIVQGLRHCLHGRQWLLARQLSSIQPLGVECSMRSSPGQFLGLFQLWKIALENKLGNDQSRKREERTLGQVLFDVLLKCRLPLLSICLFLFWLWLCSWLGRGRWATSRARTHSQIGTFFIQGLGQSCFPTLGCD